MKIMIIFRNSAALTILLRNKNTNTKTAQHIHILTVLIRLLQ